MATDRGESSITLASRYRDARHIEQSTLGCELLTVRRRQGTRVMRRGGSWQSAEWRRRRCWGLLRGAGNDAGRGWRSRAGHPIYVDDPLDRRGGWRKTAPTAAPATKDASPTTTGRDSNRAPDAGWLAPLPPEDAAASRAASPSRILSLAPGGTRSSGLACSRMFARSGSRGSSVLLTALLAGCAEWSP